MSEIFIYTVIQYGSEVDPGLLPSKMERFVIIVNGSAVINIT